MINKVILSGRITRDIEIKTTPNGTAVTQFSLAVERSFAKQGEERQMDFITCVAWGKTAEFVGRYFGKGRSIVVIGQLRTRTYEDKNGSKHYVTEVYADEVQFTFEPKTTQNVQNAPQTAYMPQGGNYMPDPPASPQKSAQAANYNDYNIFSDGGTPF
jgi:single-strand DNA-binding protein